MDSLQQILLLAAQDTTTTETAPFNPLPLAMIAIFIVFYFLMIRGPQKKEQQRRDQMMREMAKGTQVVTTGGIYGTVEGIDNDKGVVTVQIAPKVSVRFAKNAIHAVVEAKNGKSTAAAPEAAGRV